MSQSPIWRRYLRLFGPDVDADVDDELQFHLVMRTEELEGKGWSPEAARQEATRLFGDVREVASECRRLGKRRLRAKRRSSFFGEIRRDLSFAVRMAMGRRLLSAVIIVSLALGIGVNIAVFTVIKGVLLDQLPVARASELVLLKWTAEDWPRGISINGSVSDTDDGGISSSSFSFSGYRRLAEHQNVLSSVFAFAPISRINVNYEGEAVLADGQLVSGTYFPGLEVRPGIGRLIGPPDDRQESEAVVVLSHTFWRLHFGSDPSVLGRQVNLNGNPFTVVGVAEDGFNGTLQVGDSPSIFLPLAQIQKVVQREARTRERSSLVFEGDGKVGTWSRYRNCPFDACSALAANRGGRLRHRARLRRSIQSARTHADGAAGSAGPRRAAYGHGRNIGPFPWRHHVGSADRVRKRCNPPARGGRGEAQGNGRPIVAWCRWEPNFRQLLTESLLLAVAGGVVGLIISHWASRFILLFLSSTTGSQLAINLAPDLGVLGFAFLASIITGVLFGIAPALRMPKGQLARNLQSGDDRVGRSRSSLRIGEFLVVGQVALSLILLVIAGLLVRTVSRLGSVDPGFDADGVLMFSVDPTLNGYEGRRVGEALRRNQEFTGSPAGCRKGLVVVIFVGQWIWSMGQTESVGRQKTGLFCRGR